MPIQASLEAIVDAGFEGYDSAGPGSVLRISAVDSSEKEPVLSHSGVKMTTGTPKRAADIFGKTVLSGCKNRASPLNRWTHRSSEYSAV